MDLLWIKHLFYAGTAREVHIGNKLNIEIYSRKYDSFMALIPLANKVNAPQMNSRGNSLCIPV